MKPDRLLCYMFLSAILDLTDSIPIILNLLANRNIALIYSVTICEEKNNQRIVHGQGASNTNCILRACLHGGGGPQIGEVTYVAGHPTYHVNVIMRDYMDRWITSPTWGSPNRHVGSRYNYFSYFPFQDGVVFTCGGLKFGCMSIYNKCCNRKYYGQI